jgi:hypothetical protein
VCVLHNDTSASSHIYYETTLFGSGPLSTLEVELLPHFVDTGPLSYSQNNTTRVNRHTVELASIA